MSIIDTIKTIELISKPQPASQQEIAIAEKELSLKFANDYKDYLKAYGTITFYGHELTGISNTPYKNVVYVTLQERECSNSIPVNWYVIERTNIDGIVIWQSANGAIYQTAPNTTPQKICSTLIEYISM